MADEFEWGQLPREWWLRTAATLGASERDAVFAASKHQGASNTAAARAAGFGKPGAGQRTEGHRRAKSNKINQMLALAVAEAGGGYDGTLTQAEIKSTLTAMVRGSDPNTRLKAIDAFTKLEATERGQRQGSEIEQTPAELIMTFLKFVRAEAVPKMFAEFALRHYSYDTPWLTEFVPLLKQDDAWPIYRGWINTSPSRLAELEAGPVLSLDEILARCGYEDVAKSTRRRGSPEEASDAA